MINMQMVQAVVVTQSIDRFFIQEATNRSGQIETL